MLSSGYEGVREIQKRLTNTMGWSATSGMVRVWGCGRCGWVWSGYLVGGQEGMCCCLLRPFFCNSLATL